MEENIIHVIKNIYSTIDIERIEYSNKGVSVDYLISLNHFRMEMYANDSNSDPINVLTKKNQCLDHISKLGIREVKLVSDNHCIYYFDTNFIKIYLIINSMKKEVQCLQ